MDSVEIISRSRRHSGSIGSYEVFTGTHYASEDRNSTKTHNDQVDRVNRRARRPHHWYGWSILASGYIYEPINANSTRWAKTPAGTPIGRDVLDLDFPEVFSNVNFRDCGDLYHVEGTGYTKEHHGRAEIYERLFQMKIKKSDFSLIELAWLEPQVKGSTTSSIPEIGNLIRTVHKFSRFDEISIEEPAPENVIEGLMGFWPPDGLESVGLTNSIGFFLQPAATLVDIKIEPHHPLLLAPSFDGNYRMKPKREFEPGTTYLVSVSWKYPRDEIVNHSWSFTTGGLR